MSGHSTYNPTNPVMKWLDDRLPLPRLMYDSFVSYPVPRNLNYWYTFGGILMIMMVSQIITGIVLVMHYTPHVDMAFDSVEHIRRNVNFGNIIQKWHAVGASFFFIAVYIHIARGMYYGSYKAPREILWMLGVAIFLIMMATGFMGYVLPWGQMSFWGAKVITNLFSAVPFFGEAIVTWLWGGFSVDNATLQRFFSLHYLLPFVLVGVVILHVWALHVTGQSNPTGVEVKSGQDTVAFTPFATVKDAFALCVFFIVFTIFVFFLPDYLGHSINYEEANPLVTPEHIVPEWYYLPFYAILRAVPDKLSGCCSHVRLDPGVVHPALARHVEGSLRNLPADLQAAVLAADDRLLHPGRGGCQSAGRLVDHRWPDRDGLLLRPLPHSAAACRITGNAQTATVIHIGCGAGEERRQATRSPTG